MKKLLAIFSSIIIAVNFLVIVSCGKSRDNDLEDAEEIILLNGYESYDDLVKTSFKNYYEPITPMHSGTVSICDEEKYVTQGKSCAKFYYDYNIHDDGIRTSTEYESISGFSFKTEDFGEDIKYINKIEYLSFDVYNDSNIPFNFYMNVYSENRKVNYFSDGQLIVPNDWTKVIIEFKPWQFNENDFIESLDFYICGINKIDNKVFTLYYDNFQIKKINNTEVPIRAENDGINYGGIELLNFDNPGDIDFVRVNESVKDVKFSPFASLSYDRYFKGLGDKGSLRLDMYTPFRDNNMLYIEDGTYDITIQKSLVKEILDSESISVNIYNTNNFDMTVSLALGVNKNGKMEYKETKKNIKKRQKAQITCSDSDILEIVEEILIKVYVWNMPESGTLYFSNLVYSI